MSALTVTGWQIPNLASRGEALAAPWKAGAARSTACWGRSGAVVTVCGEIDAANADHFAGHLIGYATYCEWLVLNLANLGFIGLDGFSALQTMHARFAGAGKHWAMVPGTAVIRLLRVCVVETGLPIFESVTTALPAVQKPRMLSQPRK